MAQPDPRHFGIVELGDLGIRWDRKVVFDEIVVNESWRRPVGPDRRKELGAEVRNFTGSL